MWTFTGYEKMAEQPHQWHLDEAGERQLAKATWVVMEKIHGANLCIVTDGTTVCCANRRQWLAPNDTFFGYQTLLGELDAAIRATFRLSQQQTPTLRCIAIYGELFGGAYPHPDVSPVPHVQPVQTGVYYAPGIAFCAFDLAWETGEVPGSRAYVDYERALHLFAEAGMPHAIPLHVGSYTAALNYPLGFATTIPPLFGLPPLADNIAEGVVIKPLHEIIVPTTRGPIRPILKRKIPTFAEDRRYQQAQKWSVSSESPHTGPLADLRWAAYQLVTVNRLHNAISKLGYRSRHEPSKGQHLFRLLVDEIHEQLANEQQNALATLNAHDQQQLAVFIQDEVRTMLRQHFQQEARRV
jgi:Rnl2 family RNA ligase